MFSSNLVNIFFTKKTMARSDFLIFFLVFLLSIIHVQSENCVQKSPCSCEFEDGRKIDLKPLEEKILTATVGRNLTYYFNPCKDFKPALPSIKLETNDCDSTALCLLNTTAIVNGTNNYTALNLGSAKHVKFTNSATTDKYLLYEGNKYNITTMIHLACTVDYADTVLVFKQIDANTHNLILFSNAACPVFEKHAGFSTGSVLVILLFTFTSAYLFGGAAILYFLRGARGREMVPNYDFWCSLPGLVRDGAIFLQNGCKPVISNSESYDRI